MQVYPTDYFNLFYNISRFNHSDCIFNYFNLQEFKKYTFLQKKILLPIICKIFFVFIVHSPYVFRSYMLAILRELKFG